MHDDTAEVHKHPNVGAQTFAADRGFPGLGKLLVNLVHKCLDVGGGGTVADDKIVSQHGLFGGSQNLNVSCLLVVKCLGGDGGDLSCSKH